MSNKIRPRRSAIPFLRPVLDLNRIGEIFTNIADGQIGVHDMQGAPLDLIGVRCFIAGASYKRGDLVTHAGNVYRAVADISRKPWSSSLWENITASAPGGGASVVPSPRITDRGKTLTVNSVGHPIWGGDLSDAGQHIYGGTF